MYPDWLLLFVVLLIWLIGLTFFIWQQNNFLKSLFPKNNERDIRRKFEEVLRQVISFEQDIDKIKDKLSDIETVGLRHVQKVELLRYNPYDDTGGDQSFTLVLLDKKGDGVVLTSLHARSGTRVFAKPIKEGKSLKHRLSEEEQAIVEKVIKADE